MKFKIGNNHLRPKQTQNIIEAVHHAYLCDIPLNRHFILLMDGFGYAGDYTELKSHILKSSREWLRRRRITCAFVWVFESSPVKGVHLHFLMHIPLGLQKEYKAYLKSILDIKGIDTTEYKKPKSKALHTTTIDYYSPNDGGYNDMNHLCGVVRYICKGTDPKTPMMDILGELINPSNQGWIDSQRCGVSRNIDKGARNNNLSVTSPLYENKNTVKSLSKNLSSPLTHNIDQYTPEQWIAEWKNTP